MGSNVVTPEDVLESLMSDGTFDALRMKIINQLKTNEELKNNTIAMVEQSRVLNIPGAEKKTKRELFDALRQELEMPVLEKAAKAVWELILDDSGLGKEISETVERVYWQLSGRDVPPPPLLPPPTSDAQQPRKVKENKEGGQKVKEIMSKSSSRKRAFCQMSMQREVVTEGFYNHPPVVSDDGALSSNNSNA
ncbi:uncharacterized protein LOC120104194 [Phoenix dactylifera]|uniref:Uncharacterized protein LOC120104194 n=1 Tax=Phoenix dactylifera TaxID=42345 RepID=A0A8B8Z9L8_PHODC|nr:uncharacterized protein LOC120104194 [Phoenix dactylifera]XP_038970757.1 uncharacterized protein LOC120104194 [Phoenix dactylifera]